MTRGCPEFHDGLPALTPPPAPGGLGGHRRALPSLACCGPSRRRARPARAKHIIFLHQFGGPSHLDTFDMKPDAPGGHSRRVQADRDRPAGPVGDRASAAVRHGDRPVRAGPLGEPPDEEPQFGRPITA